ncbi:MAG TPA: hypothetical protein VK335_09725 [Bryobacteraceae bacterium]|nr:hypothetical protein [Bryobacteraceae bacterium]
MGKSLALTCALACAPVALAQLNVSGNAPVATPDAAPASQSITALNGTAQVALTGQRGAGVTLSGTWTATVVPELSFDGGTTWVATFFEIPNTAQYVTSVAANGPYVMVCAAGASHARVRASAFTSGTIAALLRGSQVNSLPTLYAGPAGSAAPTVSALVGGSDGANLRALSTDTSGRPVLAGSSGSNITSAATTTVKGTPGILRRIVVGTGVVSATVKLYNVAAASCSGTPGSGAAGVITLPSTLANPFSLEFNQTFSAGICVVTSGATNITVIFD